MVGVTPRRVAGIVAGILAVIRPGITAPVLLYLVPGRALATGILEIVAAILLHKGIEGAWFLVLGGIA